MNVKDPRYYIIPLQLPSAWYNFLGPIPKNEQWSMLVYGNSHAGKSAFCLKFASILQYYGTVLYANTEENLKGGTIQIKARQNNVDIRKFDFLDDETGFLPQNKIQAIREKLKSKEYKFCIIDSISAFAMTRNEVVECLNLKDEFPNTSFIFVTHMTKDEKTFAGYGMIKYMVDIAIHLDEGVADCSIKNRYKSIRTNNQMVLFKLKKGR